MTDPEVVFARFVDANPVPEVSDIGERRPDIVPLISGDHTRSEQQYTPAPAVRRAAWAAAAALVLVLAAGGLFLVWPDQPVVQPAEPPSLEDALRRDAVAAVAEWLAALNAGDIDRVMALSDPAARREADRRVHEWQAGLASQGMPSEIEGCVVASVAAGSTARVECDVRLGDLVARALGVADVVAPFDYREGLVTWHPYSGESISEVNEAYATYLRRFHPTEYEARCSPNAYSPGTVVSDRGLALTGECAGLAAPLAADVVQWIADGRPGDQP